MKKTIYGLFLATLLITGAVFGNDYYNHSGIPATGSPGSSSQMRAEFSAIESGFASLPALTGNANKAVVVNGGGTGLTVTTGGLALGGNLTISGAFATTLTVTNTTTLTLPLTGTLATLAGSETLTTKTINLTSNTLTGTRAQFNTAMSDGDFATIAGSETLTNKFLTSPVITGPTVTGLSVVPVALNGNSMVANHQLIGHITGLTFGLSGGDPTNDLFVGGGGAEDLTFSYWMHLQTAITKQSDVAWAVGNGLGGLDTGAVGNNEYFIWLIARSDTGVVDVLFSLSSSSPTMPANYDRKRLIGWFKRSAGATLNFLATETSGGGIEYVWSDPILSINVAATLTTTQRIDSLAIPNGFETTAHIIAMVTDAAVYQAILQSSIQPDLAPSTTALPGFNLGNYVAGGTGSAQLDIYTNRDLYSRGSAATADNYRVITTGFTWSRR